MGRGRGPKFFFPIPGRKSHTKVENNAASLAPLEHTTSISSTLPGPEWPLHGEVTPPMSKAERLLGTAGPLARPPSRSHSLVPQSPGYMTITVSEASFGSEYTDKASSTAVEDPSYLYKRPAMASRSSSTVLGNTYHEDSRRGSNSSSVSKMLHPQTSNSTMRSYYDPQKSPLSVSQQTSDSAVRDRALRKGMPHVASNPYHGDHVPSPLSLPTSDDSGRPSRKGKPARLDLSKLFPKPKSSAGAAQNGTLLSPNKLVNSPSALSSVSEYFPRPMTREPTPTPSPTGHAKLTKAKRQQPSPLRSPQSTSPVRLHRRDVYDSAKINVRRPPRGIQHWFEGLDDVSDEDVEEESKHLPAPVLIKNNAPTMAPKRKSSLGRVLQTAVEPPRPRALPPSFEGSSSKVHPSTPALRTLPRHFDSASQFSLQSRSSGKTKESAFSHSNLQDFSVLSMSSSESESEDDVANNGFAVRDSLDTAEHHGEIIIGKAQAYEVRPQLPSRAPSASKMSMRSTSTSAATIEVMYTPEPYTAYHFPRAHGSRRSSQDRRSSHYRQPSIIHEVGDVRPKTAGNRSLSPATISNHSARSEPQLQADGHKLMEVTEEEKALLEMMRQKRAAMAKHSFTEGYKTAKLQEDARQKTPPDLGSPSTSGFLTMDSPSTSPVQHATVASRESVASSKTPVLLPVPSRGRTNKSSLEPGTGTSILRDSSSCDSRNGPLESKSSRGLYPRIPSLRPAPPLDFPPHDFCPSSTPTPTSVSIASPTTTDLASPLPSPVTPGLRNGEADVDVKVASSQSSCDGDEDVTAALETGVIDPPSGSIKPESSHTHSNAVGVHQRRRTASSGADVAFSPPTKHSTLALRSLSTESFDLAPVSEALFAPSGIAEPKVPRRSSRRTSALTVSTTGGLRTRLSAASIASNRVSSPAASALDRRSSRIGSASVASSGSSVNSIKRESVAVGTASTRCSVSEDVLAAWGSLGGLHYNYD